MGWDGHLGFYCVVAVVEAEAADDRDFIDGDWGKELGYCHGLVDDGPVEYGSYDEVRFDDFLLDG